MKRTFITSLGLLAVMALLTGLLYPLLITGLSMVLCPARSSGSLVSLDGQPAGSVLIGQQFDSRRYFQSRPSASNYGALPPAASNAGPASEALRQAVAGRRMAYRSLNALPGDAVVPSDALFASGSGLDPHISPSSAMGQVRRIAGARSRDVRRIDSLVLRHIEPPQWGFLGQPRVNVLRLNIALDSISERK